MTGWLNLNTGAGESAWNMALDEALLEFAAEHQQPLIRFYGWKEAAATFGYFQSYAEVSSWTQLRPLIRRPTGGGLVPHDSDWTYTFVVPPSHEWYGIRAPESYERIHFWISRAFADLSVKTELAPEALKEQPGRCFVGAEKSDLLLGGRKIAGAAQRRNKYGLLIQGSVQQQPCNARREQWENSMLKCAEVMYHCKWSETKLGAAILDRTEALCRDKYSRDEYNRRK
jgi:lipoate-protein ligase A